MKQVFPHGLGQEKAKQVAVAAIQAYSERFTKYNPTAKWVSDHRAEISFTAKGMQLSGTMEVSPSDIVMDLDVPFLLRPFKGVAMGVIEEEINKWIGKAKAGEI